MTTQEEMVLRYTFPNGDYRLKDKYFTIKQKHLR